MKVDKDQNAFLEIPDFCVEGRKEMTMTKENKKTAALLITLSVHFE